MKKRWLATLALALAMMLLGAAALADMAYIIPDSNTRYLTEDELWQWNYESIGYIFNEIFARHGYVFKAGGAYDQYFRTRPWYVPNSDPDNQRACYPQMNNVEWANERLCKEVRQNMRDMGTTNPGGKSIWNSYSSGFDTLQGFEYLHLDGGQKLAVYSAPSADSWRGANGKAMVSTNGDIFYGGYESGWILVMYETNNGSVRVGYVDAGEIRGRQPQGPYLSFSYAPATMFSGADLTDDPARLASSITYLPEGTQVTYLTNYYNRYAWAYIETYVGGERVRGFVPSASLSIGSTADDDVG